MAKQIAFRANNVGDIYTYIENGAGGSCAIGQDLSDGSKFKIVVAPSTTDVSPGGSAQFVIDPAANGDVTITPSGLGDLIVSSLTTGVVQADSIGTLFSSNGGDGQVLIADTGGTPSWQNITPGTGISITNAANSITIDSTGGGLTWSVVTVAGPTPALANHGYIEKGMTLVVLTLPVTPTIGDVIEFTSTTNLLGSGIGIAGVGPGTTVRIRLANEDGYSLSNIDRYCSVRLLCVETDGAGNDAWNVLSMVGNWQLAS